MGPRRKRIRDDELLETIRTLPCMACGIQPCGEAHHVTTVKNGGNDVAANVMPLCHTHHMQWHGNGPGYMIAKYPAVLRWLEGAGRTDVLDRVKRVWRVAERML